MQRIFDIISKEVMVGLVATLPLIEIKGAIPFGISLGLSYYHSFIISFIGSMIPVPILFFLIRPVFKVLRKSRFFGHIVERLTNGSIEKNSTIKRHGFFGLLIFVSIPIPGTGVWSAMLAASLLNMRFKLVFLALFIGNFIAGLIITLLSSGTIKTINLF